MSEEKKISRRAVAKGAAWSVPAVAVAAAAPAYATSPEPPIEIDFANSTGCKIPGDSNKDKCYDKGYVLFAKIDNNTASSATVTITGITVGGVARCLVGITDYASTADCSALLASNTFTVAAGQSRYIAVFSNSSTDSSSTTVAVTFDYNVGAGSVTTTQTSNADVGGSPWQGSCEHPGSCSKTTLPSACGTTCATP